jgi:hypothetical protein
MRESNMKAVNYISILLLLVLGSCSSGLYTGLEYDDLYYLPSDKAVVKVQPNVHRQIAEGDLKAEEYYDNIYAADTLVSDEYSDAVDYEALLNENNKGSINNYYFDNYSYSDRLRRFYGNYFYPYWRDPFYFSWGWPSISFGYGYPYYYDPFWYNPYYDYGYYGYYGGFYSPWYYGSYFSPYYSSWYWPYYNNLGYYSYGKDYNNSIAYGRRERQSVYSTRWNERVQPSATSRRDGYISKGTSTEGVRRSAAETSTSITTDPGKSISTTVDNRQAINATDRKIDQSAAKGVNTANSRTSTTRSTTVTKPEYNTVNRTYTPSYSNPRMSTRPSYNNSRVSTESMGSGSSRTTPARTSPSVSAGQSRSVPSYNSAGSYSAPSRRSTSSGSYSTRSYSSSPNRSSYSSGSSGGVSRSSFSGGSSGSSSGSSSSSSHSSSSGGRR